MIMAASGKTNMKRVTLELGGKSPFVVFDDVEDLDKAVALAHLALFTNMGQNCCAGSRLFVQSKIYDKFVAKAKEMAARRTVGDPFTNVESGPQVNEEQFKKILDLIESGKKEGATLECGGSRIGSRGYFIQPTVFSNVKDTMRIAREEIFGPVQSIFKFDTMEELIERANDTCYGLASGVMTKDIDKALTFAHSINAGTVWINTYYANTAQNPFGGFKMSGIGRENGPGGIKNYLETKTVTIAVPQKNS